MKNISTLIALLITCFLFSQSGINYKAVIKDDMGSVVANQLVEVDFSILEGAAQTNVFTESHKPTTDANGIVILEIGSGFPTIGTYSAIDWDADDHYLKVLVNIGDGFMDMGTTPFTYVPYALIAEKAKNVNGLEAIDEGNGIGWRLKGRDVNFYGDIGNEAIDLSYSNTNSILNGATGDYSFASGYQTKASGSISTAMGSTSEAIGNLAIAIGSGAIASGDFSTSIGTYTEAIGEKSTAIGLYTDATGRNSVALGSATESSGTYSTAMGSQTVASGYNSTAMGFETKAESHNSIALGRHNIGGGDPNNWVGTDPLFEIGNGTFATPHNALTILKNGTITAPSLTNSLIETAGDKALITKEYADANLLASGLEALDEGNGIGWRIKGRNPQNYGNIGETAVDLSISNADTESNGATGEASTSTGYSTTASGRYSTAMGHFTSATGFGSVALGSLTVASGRLSTSMGSQTKAESVYSTSIGRYNVGGGNPLEWFEADPIFEIGIGDFSASKNALTVLKNGTITAPSLTNSLIETAGYKALVTKEFVDSQFNNFHIWDFSDVSVSSTFGLCIGVEAASSLGGYSNNIVGIGPYAMQKNNDGSNNTALGWSASKENMEGYNNTAIGMEALLNNTTNSNTAVGAQAMKATTIGFENTAVGRSALIGNIDGDSNTALGYGSLTTLTTGNNNTGLGRGAQVPNATGSNQVRVGNTSVTYAGIQVAWTVTSDKRWKDKVRDLPYGLDMVSQLRPVDYIRKNNEHETREAGFIAQDVKQLLEELGYKDQGILTTDDNGFMSLRYNDFIPVLVKAIQEQQEIISNQNNNISRLEAELNALKQSVESLKTEIKTKSR
ncbi:tail fiber domain-containing protein [Winogradskyella pulchriflava]|uniref:Tail fiber domain-containing protein n=1 Tax=Winogradskyella pulchriflava TaxID=1110688 RepID=A0ABV6QAP3_9FLAO